MTLREVIQRQLTEATRAGDTLRRDTLRLVWNALYNAEKTARRPFDDGEVVDLLAREIKSRRESVEAFRRGGREDLASREEAEIEIIQSFLPPPLDQAALTAIVDEAIAASGATSRRDMGKVMGLVMPRVKGRAEGRVVSELVAQRLAAREAG